MCFVPQVDAQIIPRVETLEEMSDRIALENEISTSSFRNLHYYESRWNPLATSTEGDRGIDQINKKYHPEVTDDCAFNPECAMEWSAKRIKDGYGYEWTSGNCYSLVKIRIPDLPKMKDIVPNSGPVKGGVAIFDYHGLKHVAYITKINKDNFEVFEANFKPFEIGNRVISYDDKFLKGFYTQS